MSLSLPQLEEKATLIRQDIITMLDAAQSGHPGGALGMADMFAALYFSVLNHRPTEPTWAGRDFLLLSNGHTCPVLYATLAEAGYFPKQELATLRQLGSRLQGHPHRGALAGVEMTSGPLGLGLSQAAGLASALKLDGKLNRVFAVLSDGEHQEGQTWEAYMFAGARKLGNLTVLIDRNNIQIGGYVEDFMPINSLKDKLSAFNWQVLEINGNDLMAVITACQEAAVSQLPTAIICNTTPGEGVSFMEGLPKWHGTPPTHQQALAALEELKL